MINIIFAIGTIIILIAYFQVARRFEILDYPNHRSSHTKPIIRGAGILFPIVFVIYYSIFNPNWPYFLLGFLFVSIISFIDDIKTLSSKSRFFVQCLSCILIAYQIDLIFDIDWYFYVLIPLLVLSVINAFNFMDGINGITGLYALVTLVSIYFLREYLKSYLDYELLNWLMLSCFAFLFFNFRNRAICFGGDVGSISISFIIIFLILIIVFVSNNYKYLFFLFVYGLDTAYTILFRKIRGEKLTEAHRLHLFQLLVHEYKLNHLMVSLLYGVTQLLLNIWIINFEGSIFIFFLPFSILMILMELLRNKIKYSIFAHASFNNK